MATDDHMTVTAVGLPEGATSMSFGKFELENGQSIENVILGYTTYGTLNAVRPIFTRPPDVPGNSTPARFFPSFARRRTTRASVASPETRPLIPLLLRPLFSGWR